MPEEQIQQSEQPTIAFVLSLLAGLWMIAGGGMMGGMMSGFGWHGMGGWMWGRAGIGGFGTETWWPWFNGVEGIIVLVAAVMLYVRPEQRGTWGVVILVVSALDFLSGMMGLLAGALGVIGGVLALSMKR
jgi:hypothetical protein